MTHDILHDTSLLVLTPEEQELEKQYAHATWISSGPKFDALQKKLQKGKEPTIPKSHNPKPTS